MVSARSSPGAGLWLAVILASLYAWLSTSVALDRVAVARPEFADWVPERFRLALLAQAAEQKVFAGKAADSLPLAERLLRKDPIAPHAAGLLGTARLGIGDLSAADRAFRTSAKLGWRDARTQIYWFETALRMQDFDRAAMRFEAIARQWPHAPATDGLSARLENDPRGFSMLSRQMAGGDGWVAAYAAPRGYQSADRLAGRARVLISAGMMGSRLGCERIAPLVNALWERNPALSGELWGSQCERAGPPGKLADGGFESQPASPQLTAFDWQFPGDGALDAAIAGDDTGGHALRVSSSAASLLPVARQRIVLKPGSYRIAWSESGRGPSRIAASLSCRTERSEAGPRPGTGLSGRRSAEIDATGQCPVPVLQLWLTPGEATVTIDNVTIDQG